MTPLDLRSIKPLIKFSQALIGVFLLITMVGCSTISKWPTLIGYHYHYDLHTVRDGDTIDSVAADYGIPAGVIAGLNKIETDADLVVEDRLKIPFISEVYPKSSSKWSEDFDCPEFSTRVKRFLWPAIGGGVSSPFGWRNGRPHEGLDMRVPVGVPIFAAHSGRVIFAGDRRDGYGKLMIIRNGYLDTYYAHQSKLVAPASSWVREGDLIGFSGNTGRTTGPHLHFEARINYRGKRQPVDPLCFYRGYR